MMAYVVYPSNKFVSVHCSFCAVAPAAAWYAVFSHITKRIVESVDSIPCKCPRKPAVCASDARFFPTVMAWLLNQFSKLIHGESKGEVAPFSPGGIRSESNIDMSLRISKARARLVYFFLLQLLIHPCAPLAALVGSVSATNSGRSCLKFFVAKIAAHDPDGTIFFAFPGIANCYSVLCAVARKIFSQLSAPATTARIAAVHVSATTLKFFAAIATHNPNDIVLFSLVGRPKGNSRSKANPCVIFLSWHISSYCNYTGKGLVAQISRVECAV